MPLTLYHNYLIFKARFHVRLYQRPHSGPYINTPIMCAFFRECINDVVTRLNDCVDRRKIIKPNWLVLRKDFHLRMCHYNGLSRVT